MILSFLFIYVLHDTKLTPHMPDAPPVQAITRDVIRAKYPLLRDFHMAAEPVEALVDPLCTESPEQAGRSYGYGYTLCGPCVVKTTCWEQSPKRNHQHPKSGINHWNWNYLLKRLNKKHRISVQVNKTLKILKSNKQLKRKKHAKHDGAKHNMLS